MLSWILKKRDATPAPTLAPTAAKAEKPAPRAAAALLPSPPSMDTAADEAAQLRAAQGDDAALLRLAQSTSTLDLKLAAVQSLAGEAALRQAEREFRSHDRKVHRLAKQRLEAAIVQRESRATAQTLLTRTQALLDETAVAVNHVVALDRDWEALPAHTLEAVQIAEFTELRARLDAQMRAHEDAQLQARKWTAVARHLLAQPSLASPPPQVQAPLDDDADTVRLQQELEALRQSRPDTPAAAALDTALAKAQEQLQALVLAREQAREQEAQEQSRALAQLSTEREQALSAAAAAPAVAPAPTPQERAAAAERTREQLQQLETLVQQAEVALADGQLGHMQRHLQAFETTLAKAHVALPERLRTRHQALWAERHRLEDWQVWGGARARDELTAEAEELARQTLAATDSSQANRPKLNLKTHGETIQALRLRWKQLNHQGAGVNQEQWRRLDAALQTAHQPLAAQHAALRAARLENLGAREALLTALEAVPLPGANAPQDAGADADADANANANSSAQARPDWKSCTRELDHFHTAWRKLGPVEHTAPQASREPLQERLRVALARIEAPLQAERDAAAAGREQLIARAQSLTQGGGGRVAPDAARPVRELQLNWQASARRLALPRGQEMALWARFKSATDAVFAQRDAASAQREAEWAANLERQEAMLERLTRLDADAAPADIERTLADADRSWREGGELPPGALETLERRFHAVRAAAAAQLGSGAQRRWQRQCDTLATHLTLCEQREDLDARGAGDDAGEQASEQASLGQRWSQLQSLPAAWSQTLAQRFERAVQPGPLSSAELDDLLLQLEAALGVPSAPAWQAARQTLKLRALKDAMEGRRASDKGPAQQAHWLLAALQQGGLDPGQRERLRALVAALRQAQIGALGSPTG